MCEYALTHKTVWFVRHVPYLASKINFVNEDMNAMMTSSRLKKITYQVQSVDKYKTHSQELRGIDKVVGSQSSCRAFEAVAAAAVKVLSSSSSSCSGVAP